MQHSKGNGIKLLFLLTTKIQQMGVKEGLAVKLLNVQDGWAFQAAAQGLLRATFVSNERLQHGPHHVELHKYIYAHIYKRERNNISETSLLFTSWWFY